MSFELDLRRFAEKAKDRADEVVGQVIFLIAEEIDRRSPVGDPSYWKSPPPAGYVGGRFRGAWQLGIDQRPTGETGQLAPEGSRATVDRLVSAIPADAAGNVYYFANNVPYAMAIEMGSASPRQAPQGIVGLIAVEFESKVREATEVLS